MTILSVTILDTAVTILVGVITAVTILAACDYYVMSARDYRHGMSVTRVAVTILKLFWSGYL